MRTRASKMSSPLRDGLPEVRRIRKKAALKKPGRAAASKAATSPDVAVTPKVTSAPEITILPDASAVPTSNASPTPGSVVVESEPVVHGVAAVAPAPTPASPRSDHSTRSSPEPFVDALEAPPESGFILYKQGHVSLVLTEEEHDRVVAFITRSRSIPTKSSLRPTSRPGALKRKKTYRRPADWSSGTFGLPDEVFNSSSSEYTDSEGDEAEDLAGQPPAKRVRFNAGVGPSPSPPLATEEAPPLLKGERAYRKPADWPSGSFGLPPDMYDASSSDDSASGDEEAGRTTAADKAEGARLEPTPVTPATPATPGEGGVAWDALEAGESARVARARLLAEKYKPKSPSGLRASSRYSNSTVDSEAEAGEVAAVLARPGEGPSEETGMALAGRPIIVDGVEMDPEVVAAVLNVRKSAYIPFDWPAFTRSDPVLDACGQEIWAAVETSMLGSTSPAAVRV
ncbi:MAG: hypothetical protein M1838_005317 [Thelocarpon superellum]|nr:MAG: hypothetical protein M1838_005317 [Thelocarpon superellum]